MMSLEKNFLCTLHLYPVSVVSFFVHDILSTQKFVTLRFLGHTAGRGVAKMNPPVVVVVVVVFVKNADRPHPSPTHR